MRTLITLLLCVGVTLGLRGQQQPSTPCGQEGQEDLLSGPYYDSVLEDIRHPDYKRAVIDISFSPTPESQLILSTDGHNFELLRGTPTAGILKTLQSAASLCKLPPDPARALDLVHIRWERMKLSSAKFQRLHSDFTSALSHYASRLQSRSEHTIASGSIDIYLHVPVYEVVYRSGMERSAVTVIDFTDDSKEMDPVIKWVRGILTLAKEGSWQEATASLN